MRKYLPFFYLILVFTIFATFTLSAMAHERSRDFRKERPRSRGNERSERPHRVTTGNINHAGNGCPAGTMRVIFAPDNLSFSILFDQFVAEVSEVHPRRDVIICNALIPIEIPENLQMEITRVDFRGFVALPQRANAALTSVFNFRGAGGDRDRMNLRFRFSGPVMDNYEISTDVMTSTQDSELSPCGGNVHLRVLNQLNVVSRALNETAQVTIDSIDGSSNAVYHVNWRSCAPGRNRLRPGIR